MPADWVSLMLLGGDRRIVPGGGDGAFARCGIGAGLRRWSHGGRPGRHHRHTAIGQPVRTLPGGTGRGLDADGNEERSMNNRLTWALRKDGDGWKIVHEHTSAPAGEGGKVSLKRG